MSRFSGSDLNDRLRQAGMLARFSAAVENRDESEMTRCLQQVGFSAQVSKDIAVSILYDPSVYDDQV